MSSTQVRSHLISITLCPPNNINVNISESVVEESFAIHRQKEKQIGQFQRRFRHHFRLHQQQQWTRLSQQPINIPVARTQPTYQSIQVQQQNPSSPVLPVKLIEDLVP